MPLTRSEVLDICTEIVNCRETNEIRALITSRTGARSPEVQEAMWAIMNSAARPRGADACAIHYFDAIVHERIRARDTRRSAPPHRRMAPHEERVVIAERDATREMATARSWSELVQLFITSCLNLADAETAETLTTDRDPRFPLLLHLASALEQGPDADTSRAWRQARAGAAGAPALERLLADTRRLLADGDWSDLPRRGDSLATLRRLRCDECGAMSWITFWNYIGRWDWERRKRIAEGSLNVLACRYCGSTDVTIAAITSYLPELQLAALPAMVCCETERAQVILMPLQLLRHDPAIGLAVRGLVQHLCGQSPRGRRIDIDAWDITFLPKVFAQKIAATSDSLDPGQVHETYLREVLRPLSRRIQSADLRLDVNEPRIAEAVEDFRLVTGRGLMMTRSDFESRDPSLTALDALIGFLNEQCGLFVAACVTYATGAEEAVSAARWGEVSWLAERAEQAADKVSPDDSVRRHLKHSLVKMRVSLHFQMGEVGRAADDMLEVVAYQREFLSRSPADLHALTFAVDLADSLNSCGDYLARRDLGMCRRLLSEALDLCDRIERSPLFAELPERARQLWALAKSGALSNYARSCHEAKLAMTFAARLRTYHSVDHPAVRWYFQDGITTAHLQASLDTISNEFPQYVDARGIDDQRTSAELDRVAVVHYRRALAVAEKHRLHRYAAMQWSNLARLHTEHGRRWRAAWCSRRAEAAAHASGHLPAIVEATFTAAQLCKNRGDRTGARKKLVVAYNLWATMRRYVVFDDLRIAAGRQIDPIVHMIGSTIDEPPDEWIGTLERMKAGSLADGILSPPLRLAGTSDDETLRRLGELEARILEERRRIKAPRSQRTFRWFRSRGARANVLTNLEREHDLLRQSLLLKRPYLADTASVPQSSVELVTSLRARFAEVAFVGFWIDGDDLLVYGLSPRGQSFAFRHRFVLALRTDTRLPFTTIDQYLDAYRTTAAADLPPENLAGTMGGAWFRALWQHIEQHTGPIARAVISPHGRLRGFPWATMWDGARWAANRTAFSELIAIAPAPAGAADNIAARPQRILVLADPDLGNPQFALPGARREAARIAALAMSANVAIELRTGRDATRAALFADAQSADIVHVACHGSFDENDPWRNALHLSGGSNADAVTMTQITHDLKLRPGSLVVLSACDTGKAQYRPADEAAGLARSFHLAGAANVIAALWPVNDAATEELMTSFYALLLLEGRPAADALALVQRSMIQSGHHGPSSWGSFVLYER